MDSRSAILEQVDRFRLEASRELNPEIRAVQGQFLTPLPVARLMASFFAELPESVRLLDPGAGAGSLTAAFVDEALSRRPLPRSINVTAYETDTGLLDYLMRTLDLCEAACQARGVAFSREVVADDFMAQCRHLSGSLFGQRPPSCNCVIMNPPYRKIAANSETRARLRLIHVETGNLYTAFMAVALQMLETNGQFVSITPRSSCNGTYFAPFRHFFLDRTALRRIHLFESRRKAFSEDDVLQENVVLLAQKGGRRNGVLISAGDDAGSPVSLERTVPHGEVVRATDPEKFIRILPDALDTEVADWMHSLQSTPEELGVTISTGRVVDFRALAHLRMQPEEGAVPLLYPAHCRNASVQWPRENGRKPNAIVRGPQTDELLVPAGAYVLVKRFTSKEERRRVVAALCDSKTFFDGPFGIENHLNYIHEKGEGLPLALAKGLTAFLNSSIFDAYFRQFSGHTQVNATDLRMIRFPSRAKLSELGERIGAEGQNQAVLDELCREVIFDMTRNKQRDPVRAQTKIREAVDVLKQLDMPREQRNERSALALLALLDLKPDTAWAAASRPMRGITEMMDYFKEHYGKKYAPNTRETVCRQTIHQFEQAGLVESNPDDPARPINSPHWCYRITEPAFRLLTCYGSQKWAKCLKAHRGAIESLRHRYAQEREMTRIPVKIADGRELYLSAGKHNELVRQIIREFCPRFAGGGRLLYVGDTETKWAYLDEEQFAHLGVTIDLHGKFPDVVVLDEKRKWLFLIEAVTSHGPVNPKRHEELKRLFAKCRFGIVFVTAFAERGALSKYQEDISWETEVWVAESPSHLIHFNGDRFMGPHRAGKGRR